MPEKVFQFAPLSQYSFKDRLIIRIADIFSYALISLVAKTIRYEIRGMENLEKIEKDEKIPIYTFWHNRIFLSAHFFRNKKIAVMISQSKDGEYIARIIQRFGYGAVRGSSTRGGMEALLKMIKLAKEGFPGGFAADGPKGPKYEAKIGPCLLAKKTGDPVMPFSIECRKFWQLGSWDNLQIPMPFTRALLEIAEPIYIGQDAENEELESKRAELEKSLNQLIERGEKWRLENK